MLKNNLQEILKKYKRSPISKYFNFLNLFTHSLLLSCISYTVWFGMLADKKDSGSMINGHRDEEDWVDVWLYENEQN